MVLIGLTRDEAIEDLNKQEIKKLMKSSGVSEMEAKIQLGFADPQVN